LSTTQRPTDLLPTRTAWGADEVAEGDWWRLRGDYEQAATAYRRGAWRLSLGAHGDVARREGQAVALYGLALTHAESGDVAAMREALASSLRAFSQTWHYWRRLHDKRQQRRILSKAAACCDHLEAVMRTHAETHARTRTHAPQAWRTHERGVGVGEGRSNESVWAF
jgi:hypothetical protein